MNKIKGSITKWYNELGAEYKRLVYIIPVSILLGILLCSFSSCAEAGEFPHHPPSIDYTIDDYSGDSLGVAMSQQQFDLSSDKWQVFAGYGNVEGDEALAVALAVGYNGALVSGSYAETIDEEPNKEKVRAVAVGVSLKLW